MSVSVAAVLADLAATSSPPPSPRPSALTLRVYRVGSIRVAQQGVIRPRNELGKMLMSLSKENSAAAAVHLRVSARRP